MLAQEALGKIGAETRSFQKMAIDCVLQTVHSTLKFDVVVKVDPIAYMWFRWMLSYWGAFKVKKNSEIKYLLREDSGMNLKNVR